jgi:hypothetical protein
VTVAEERRLELRVGALERRVVPVEPAARLGRRDQKGQDDGAEQCFPLRRARPGVRAREDARGRLAPQVLDGVACILAGLQVGRVRLQESAHERAILVQRRATI